MNGKKRTSKRSISAGCVSVPLGLDYAPLALLPFGSRIASVGYARTPLSSEEKITQETLVSDHVVANFYSPGLTKHSRSVLTRTHPWKTAWFHLGNGECVVRNGKLLLNGMRWYSFFELIPGWRESYGRSYPLELFEIDEVSIRSLGPSPDPAPRVFAHMRQYHFGNRIVRMASDFKMECATTNGEVCWQINLKSHLYTAIDEHDGMLYFGTSGNGGRCWGVSLANGDVRFSVNTGGTEAYIWWGGQLICTESRNGTLLALDRSSGAVLATLAAGNILINSGALLLVVDDWLYTTGHNGGQNHIVAFHLPMQLETLNA
ncbi:MAG: hypothetical protein LBQ20_06205 [Rhodanobacter sp.]|jgi:archaeosine-15-forming tRNA-guanine transglycosylase|nr:hypothetical protein [Rhodanobacter sp.]